MAKAKEKNINLGMGTGRRKKAVARVYLRQGKGEIIVNRKKVDEYFANPLLVYVVKQPLVTAEVESKYDVLINVGGGGQTGQAGACCHGIARALVSVEEALRTVVKREGFLTRDSRMVERKKFGRKGARRRFQFSKR